MESLKSLKGVKVKVLFCSNIGIFESLVNDFCKLYKVIDIKYSIHEGIHYALVLYKD